MISKAARITCEKRATESAAMNARATAKERLKAQAAVVNRVKIHHFCRVASSRSMILSAAGDMFLLRRPKLKP